MLLLGGSAVINAITGMNIYAAAFLIPIGGPAETLYVDPQRASHSVPWGFFWCVRMLASRDPVTS